MLQWLFSGGWSPFLLNEQILFTGSARVHSTDVKNQERFTALVSTSITVLELFIFRMVPFNTTEICDMQPIAEENWVWIKTTLNIICQNLHITFRVRCLQDAVLKVFSDTWQDAIANGKVDLLSLLHLVVAFWNHQPQHFTVTFKGYTHFSGGYIEVIAIVCWRLSNLSIWMASHHLLRHCVTW